jgi:hypothetical protein
MDHAALLRLLQRVVVGAASPSRDVELPKTAPQCPCGLELTELGWHSPSADPHAMGS